MPLRLYRFLKFEYAIHALETRTFRVGRFEHLNDPFDSFPKVETLDGKPEDPIEVQKRMVKWNSENGVLSFSETPHNPLLWGHYADSHRGIALGFDYHEETPVFNFLAKVDYADERPIVTLKDLDLDDDGYIEPFEKSFTTKATDWAYEEEHRLVVDFGECTTQAGHYFFKFPDYLPLRAVILGVRCPIDEGYIRRSLRSHGQNLDPVLIARAQIDPNSFGILVPGLKPPQSGTH